MENTKAYIGYEKLKDESNSIKDISDKEKIKTNKEKSLNQFTSEKIKKHSSEDFFNSEKSDSIKNESYITYEETNMKLNAKANDTQQISSKLNSKNESKLKEEKINLANKKIPKKSNLKKTIVESVNINNQRKSVIINRDRLKDIDFSAIAAQEVNKNSCIDNDYNVMVLRQKTDEFLRQRSYKKDKSTDEGIFMSYNNALVNNYNNILYSTKKNNSVNKLTKIELKDNKNDQGNSANKVDKHLEKRNSLNDTSVLKPINSSSKEISMIKFDNFDKESINSKAPFEDIKKKIKFAEDEIHNSSDDGDNDSEEDDKKNEEKAEKSRKLMRFKQVYDSLSENDTDDDIELDSIILPESIFRKYLELFIFLGVMYSVFITPLNLAIGELYRYKGVFILEIIIDSLFIIEFLTGFFTAYYDLEENIVTERFKVINKYLDSWFLIDGFCAYPFNSIHAYWAYNNLHDYHIYTSSQLWILIRILKLFKVFINNTNLINLGKMAEVSTLSRFTFSYFIFLLITHVISCILVFLAHLDAPNWLSAKNLLDSTFFDQYIAAIYFNLTTIFTIGYGDILSVSLHERVYNIILMTVGIMVYSYGVSSLSTLVQESDINTINYEKNNTFLREICEKYKINPKLYQKISRFLKYKHSINKIDNYTLFNDLPLTTRNELMFHMYYDVITSFVFFRNFNNLDFINKVILSLKPIRTVKNDILIKEGDLVEEALFIKSGSLSLEVSLNLNQFEQSNKTMMNRTGTKASSILQKLDEKKLKLQKKTFIQKIATMKIVGKKEPVVTPTPDIKTIKIITFRRNEHFGDVLMFLNQPSPMKIRVKSRVADLFLLRKIDYANLAVEFPDIIKKAYSKSVHNFDKILSLIAKHRHNLKKKEDDSHIQISYPDNCENQDILNQMKNPDLQPIKEDLEQEGMESSINYSKQEKFELNMNTNSDISTVRSEYTIDYEKKINEVINLVPVNIPKIIPEFLKKEYISNSPSINDENTGLYNDQQKLSSEKEDHILDNISCYYAYKNGNRIPNGGRLSVFSLYDQMKDKSSVRMESEISSSFSFSINSIPKIENKCTDENHFCHNCKVSLEKYIDKFKIIKPESPDVVKQNEHRSFFRKKTEIFVFGDVSNELKPSSSIKEEEYNDNIDIDKSLGSDDYKIIKSQSSSEASEKDINAEKPQVEGRKMKLFQKVKKNIANSNINTIDPGNFYKKWLLDIHTEKIEKNKRKNSRIENNKLLKRLDQIDEMFSKQKVI